LNKKYYNFSLKVIHNALKVGVFLIAEMFKYLEAFVFAMFS